MKIKEIEPHNYTIEKLLNFPTKLNNNNKLNVPAENTSCPFACPNCELLESEFVKNRYQVSRIIEDNNRLIIEPFGRDVIK